MFGCCSCASSCASRSKRARRSLSATKAAGRSLIATSRFRRESVARQTSPIPPSPSLPVISYEPMRLPINAHSPSLHALDGEQVARLAHHAVRIGLTVRRKRDAFDADHAGAVGRRELAHQSPSAALEVEDL